MAFNRFKRYWIKRISYRRSSIGSIVCIFVCMLNITIYFWGFVKTSSIYDKFLRFYSFLHDAWALSYFRHSINWNMGNCYYYCSFPDSWFLSSIYFYSYNSRDARKNDGPLQHCRRNGWSRWQQFKWQSKRCLRTILCYFITYKSIGWCWSQIILRSNYYLWN